MSITPIITFKAGICEVDTSSRPYKVKASPRPGYIYLFTEDELLHFCWRERSVPLDQPELDLVMIPTDGQFVPYDANNQPHVSAKTNGRLFVLKFLSSSQRHLFWLQSKPQGRNGDPTWFSPRDRKIGDIVHRLLQGEEVDVAHELAAINNTDNDDRRGGDDDEPMEDVEGHGNPDEPHEGDGGAGPGATGGDVRQEGESAREGGADGARAAASGPPDAAAAVRNFLDSLRGNAGTSQGEGNFYPLLSDLLTPPITVPVAREATEEQIDELLSFLPPSILVFSQQVDQEEDTAEPTAAAVQAAKEAMSLGQKKALLEKVLRSPLFHQSLTSLSMAIRDGGLPSIADALSIKVENGGYIRGSQVPLGGGDAVEAFVEGVKKSVQKK
ncbi:proteasome complex subunit Rpn13 ubiquitin receptor-domain-containing protein [Durotheca rogersii]|uniref:proteasome complex subunit Rpn13 ubiquitin receptor-domain-containing protein n=1 Tax=Durotheca rogersii TaxID=419775 RepID=UPI002220F227|nr:proteasome complex subunit Rpn13 ubiquitin receptor-domain-containing protein [Durotheca rogersii]KAI5866837.1 proteasome complex subunit Rpn13 ubiquitin receptor-domain-containing protein [Durotheca rogersii]